MAAISGHSLDTVLPIIPERDECSRRASARRSRPNDPQRVDNFAQGLVLLDSLLFQFGFMAHFSVLEQRLSGFKVRKRAG